MRKYFATGCMAAVALAWSFGMTGCCCQRKGLVLRGDWSLEMNRVPHMRSNGPTYSGDSCDTPCDDYSCTSEGCVDGNCVGCRRGGGGGAAGGMARGARGEYYEQGGVRGGGYEGGEGMPAPPQPTPAAQSRFHPVPTRPVFEPQRSVAYGPDDSAPATSMPSASGGSRAGEQQRPPVRRSAPSSDPRGNRVAVRGASAPIEREIAQASAEEEFTLLRVVEGEVALEPTEAEVAESPVSDHATSTSAWRVKTRRS